jgi:small subunit ribosomal protein S2
MAVPEITMRQLLEAGVHFGHHTRRWNPKMRPFIFGVRNGVHILDLQQTQPLLQKALTEIRNIVSKGGRILFVGTKRQAQDTIAESAKRCGQYYVNQRWLGGMMTNWKTITASINRLRELEKLQSGDQSGFTKKELLMMARERNKLESSIGGIKDMGGQPDAMFIIDTNKEDIAIKEANKLGIPVFAIVDSNSNLDGVDYPIPGNDDALRAIDLYCELVVGAVVDGLQAELGRSKKDLGTAEDVKVNIPAEKAKSEKKAEEKVEDNKEPKEEDISENKAEDKDTTKDKEKAAVAK